MSLRYERLVDERISDQELLPESVPHILHQDLSYVWFLSMRRELRPRGWLARCEAWKDLLTLFLLGGLDLEPIDTADLPIQELLVGAGFSEVFWLKTRADRTGVEIPRYVGVTSTTVLVRPLPDFNTDLADFLRERIARDRRPDELRHFARLATAKLREVASDGAMQLARVLESEFDLGQNTPDASRQRAGQNVQLPLLKRIAWSGQSEFDPLTVFVRGDREAAWAPQCTTCNAFLTREENAFPIDVGVKAESVDVQCRRCGAANTIDLEKLLIWQRTGTEVVLWDTADALQGRRPPKPVISGIDVVYRWAPAEVRGDTNHVELRLRFAGREIKAVHVDECFFKSLVVIGPRDRFEGLPVRPQWLDAVREPESVVRSGIQHSERTTEYRIWLKGHPAEIRKSFGAGAIEEFPAAAVGVFPNPDRVGSGWKLYRAFTASAPQLTLQAANGWRPLLPGLVESRSGCPRAVSVTAVASENTGALLLCPGAPSAAMAHARIAIDFGTSNTLVYAEDTDGNRRQEVAINPGEARSVTRWYGAIPGSGDPAGWLIPTRSTEAWDRYVIPSALWRSGDVAVIRWSDHQPEASFQAITGFKWDRRDRTGEFSRERREYMREVLALTLPVLASSVGPIKDLELGVTFPLAFDHEQKGRFRALLEDVRNDTDALFGIRLGDPYSISESAACIAAFGVHREGETFLIADMGGGTLDLALVTMVDDGAGRPRPEVQQIGSLRIGGEEFIRALAKAGNAAMRHTAEWRIRDQIASGNADTMYGTDQRVTRMLNRFTTIAFEYLRTMILAHREAAREPGAIKLLLVGNGWHLVDAFSTDRRAKGPRRVWRDHFEHLLQQLGLPDVELYQDGLSAVPSKHLAALGAMNNMLAGHLREIEGDSQPVRLPAGRSLRFASTLVPWSRLVGTAERLHEVEASDFRAGALSVTAEGPAVSLTWSHHLARSFAVAAIGNIPTLPEPKLRQRLVEGLRDAGQELAIGPLQILVEDSWIPTLEDVK